MTHGEEVGECETPCTAPLLCPVGEKQQKACGDLGLLPPVSIQLETCLGVKSLRRPGVTNLWLCPGLTRGTRFTPALSVWVPRPGAGSSAGCSGQPRRSRSWAQHGWELPAAMLGKASAPTPGPGPASGGC